VNDSRQYRFAFLIRGADEFPEDFPHFTERTLFPALFLPRDDPDWFGRSANPARVVLFTGETLEVHFHPESGKPPASIVCDEYLSIQTGRFFLIGWIGFVSKEADLKLPYNRRIDEPVHIFLGVLRARLLRPDGASPPKQPLSVNALDLKFRNALDYEIDGDEMERTLLFIAPRLRSYGFWPFRINRWTPGNLIVLTDRRVLWITENHGRARQTYGAVTCYAPLGGIARVEASSSSAVSWLVVSLRNGKTWKLDIPGELAADAREFAAAVGSRSVAEAR
jgi:hypothetical protein